MLLFRAIWYPLFSTLTRLSLVDWCTDRHSRDLARDSIEVWIHLLLWSV